MYTLPLGSIVQGSKFSFNVMNLLADIHFLETKGSSSYLQKEVSKNS